MSYASTDKATNKTPFTSALEKAEARKDLNAFISLNRNDSTATAPKGRLSGMIIALKDNIHFAGLPNTNGTPALADFIASSTN